MGYNLVFITTIKQNTQGGSWTGNMKSFFLKVLFFVKFQWSKWESEDVGSRFLYVTSNPDCDFRIEAYAYASILEFITLAGLELHIYSDYTWCNSFVWEKPE